MSIPVVTQTEETSLPSAQETARYVALMTGELVSLAKASDLPLLAYFLDMARLEATAASNAVNEETAA